MFNYEYTLDNEYTGIVLLETLEYLLVVLERVGVLPRVEDEPDLLLDKGTEPVHHGLVHVARQDPEKSNN